MKTDDFDYYLPENLIAQTPLEKRDESRMMVLDRHTGAIEHKHFYDIIDYLNKGDILVLNNTKVIPARLFGVKENTEAHIEILLLKNIKDNTWECLTKPAKRVKEGTIISFGDGLLKAKCIKVDEEGIRHLDFIYDGIFYEILDKDEYNNFISTDIELNKIYECLNVNVGEILHQIQVDYPDRVVNKDSIKTFIEDEKLRRFNELIDNKFNENQLVQLFTYIENNDRNAIDEYVDWNSDVPTIFEYILGIAWYRFSNRSGNILEYMKLSLDANLLPKTHAAGGTADIVYEYNKTNDYPEHKVLLEATLTESTSQRKSEMEPVSRHLMREIQENDNDDTYAVFVANILQEEVLSDFRSRKNYQFRGKNSVKSGLKIISLSIRDIIKLINIKIQYSKLYKIFDEAYKDTNINDLEWYEKLVKNKINNL